MIELGLGLVIGLVLMRGGVARGRYDMKRQLLDLNLECKCEHSSNLHNSRGFGRCLWESKSGVYECGCLRFSPDLDEV